MPNGEEQGRTVWEVVLDDRASGPAEAISQSVTGLLNRLRDLKERGVGVIRDILTRPLEAAGEKSEGFRNKLIALGAAIGGFLAFRKMKNELTEIFNEAVMVEGQLVRLANLTGSDRFAEQTLGWARRWAVELRIPREELFSISEGLAQIGINAAKFDPSGIVAAGQAAGGVASVVTALRQAALDPSYLLRLQETFRALPFERLQEIIRTTQPGDFQGRIEALNTLFREVYGDNLERSRRSVIGLRQGLRELITQFRETIAGVGSPLFNFFREQLEKAVDFNQRSAPTIRAIGQTISSILETTLRSVMQFVDFVLDRFGVSLSDIADKGEQFRTRFLIPVQAEIIGYITRIELFAERAFGTIAEFLDKLRDEEWQRKATAIGGIGGVVLGMLLRRPTLIIGGLGLLKIHHGLSAPSDEANAAADVGYFERLLDDIWSALPSTQEGWSDLAILAGVALLASPLAPVGAGFILGGLINKGYRSIVPEWAQDIIEEYGGFFIDPAGATARRIGEAGEEREERRWQARQMQEHQAVQAAEDLDIRRARALAAGDEAIMARVESTFRSAARAAGRTSPAELSYQTAEGETVRVTVDMLDPTLALAYSDEQVRISTEREMRSDFQHGVMRIRGAGGGRYR